MKSVNGPKDSKTNGPSPMTRILKLSFAAALYASAAIFTSGGALAQDAGDMAVRLGQLEEQLRQLSGQVEELTFELRETRGELARIKSADGGQAPLKKKKLAAAEKPLAFEEDQLAETPAPARKKKIAASQGVEEITSPPDGSALAGEQFATRAETLDGSEEPVVIRKAPGPKKLGVLSGTLPGSSNFEGELLVNPDEPAAAESQVETVALGTEATDTPESLYERSYESLLRRQFGEAEGGFRTFLERHRDHSLAGNAQYWLGETFYVQGDYKQAAQSFLGGYQEFPKGRKAADSLLKLGLSLNRLGQKDQACSAFAAVGDKFPKAAEAKKRATAELKRGNC